ncbi:MAG: hypothetical protein WC335_08670 [Candidatus Omnitrophota bacterium]|jgi:hypothetical protein
MNSVWAASAGIVGSPISFIGVVGLLLRDNALEKIMLLPITV